MHRVISALLLVCAAVLPAMAQRPGGLGGKVDLEFALRDARAIDEIEIRIPDPASGRSQRRPISDLMLRLVASRSSISDALRLPDGAPVDRETGLLRASVYIVTAGRILAPVAARCDRWIEGMTVCTVECGGGTFALKRSGEALALLVGKLPRGTDEGETGGFQLGACEGAGGADRIVAPATRRPLVELPLQARQ